MPHYRRGLRAFTLIEIMIAIAIIAILASIAVPNFRKARERSQCRSCYANLKSIAGALEWYCADINQDYSIDSDEDFQPLIDGGYLKTIPECPTKGQGHYKATGGSDQAECLYHGTIHPVSGDDDD